jgi:hypothetical protein
MAQNKSASTDHVQISWTADGSSQVITEIAFMKFLLSSSVQGLDTG